MTSLTIVQGNACWHDRATKTIGPTTHQINWYCPDCGQTRTTYPPPFASRDEAPAAVAADDRIRASAYEHCFKAHEMPAQGEQLYLFDLTRIKLLHAAPAAIPAPEAEIAALKADAERLDWLDKNPGRVKRSIGYRGATEGWMWTDADGYGHDAADLRNAIDLANKS